MSTTTSTDWIEWTGGECPEAKDTVIMPKQRNGNILDPRPAGISEWRHNNGELDVVAYRIISPLPQPLQPPSWSKGFHNPANLPDAGEGFRFLLKEEVGQCNNNCAKWAFGKWTEDKFNGIHKECTYRVPRDTPFPPSPAPEPVAEWRLTNHLPGFRELVEGEEWHRADGWKEEWLTKGWRPLLKNEYANLGDEIWWNNMGPWRNQEEWMLNEKTTAFQPLQRTRRPLPKPTKPSPVYRELLPDELMQEWYEIDYGSGSWAKSNNWMPAHKGRQDAGYKYHTLRPLPVEVPDAVWRPKKGDWFQVKFPEDKEWRAPQYANFDFKYHTDSVLYRRCSSPEPTPAPNNLADTTQPASATLETQPKQEQETPNTMNTQDIINTTWIINDGGTRRKVKVYGVSDDTIAVKSGLFGKTRVYKIYDWRSMAGHQVVKPLKAKNHGITYTNPRPLTTFRKYLTSRLTWLMLGATFQGPIWAGLKTVVAFCAGLVAQYLNK